MEKNFRTNISVFKKDARANKKVDKNSFDSEKN